MENSSEHLKYLDKNFYSENSFNKGKDIVLNESKEKNEDQKMVDKFIDDLSFFFKFFFEKSCYLINCKDNSKFPTLNENDNIISLKTFLQNINDMYNTKKEKEDNNGDIFKDLNINETLKNRILDILEIDDLCLDGYSILFQLEKYEKNKDEKKNELNKIKNWKTNPLNPIFNRLIEFYTILKKECNFTRTEFDSRGHLIIPNKNNILKRGKENYYPPYGYLGLGLNVSQKYEKDGDWLLKKDSNWAIAYFGIHSNDNKNLDIKKTLHDICFKEENLKIYEKENDFEYNHKWKKKCEKGMCLSDKIENVEKDAGIIKNGNIYYKVLFMAKVKIDEISQPKKQDIWVSDKKFVRIYRILFKEVKEIN